MNEERNLIGHLKNWKIVMDKNNMRSGVLVILIVITLIFLCGCGRSEKTVQQMNCEQVIFGTAGSYCEQGYCYADMGGMAHFVDPYTGKTSVICSRPNCEHKKASGLNPTSVCDAYLGYMPESLFVADDNEFFLQKHEYDGVHTKGLYDLSLVRADINGSNRKVIAELENVQHTTSTAYGNGIFAMGYQLRNDIETVGNGVEGNLDRFISGVYMIDTRDGSKKKIREIEGYQALCTNIHIIGDRLYYQVTYQKDYIDYEKSLSENPTIRAEFEKEIQEKSVNELYYYDIPSNTETCYLKTSVCSPYATADRILYRTDGGIPVYYVAGEKKDLKNIKELTDLLDYSNHELTCVYLREGSILCVVDGEVKEYSVKTGEISDFADGKLNGKGVMITAETDNLTYYFIYVGDGRMELHCVEKEQFNKGDISLAVKIF